jgi:hypothetical protein
MLLRSFSQLDIPLAWRRTRLWAQSGGLDIADRLPFEVLDRLYGDEGPPLDGPDREPSAITLVASSKKSGLARTFVRLSPMDLILYQALVDQLAPDIEAALPPRDVAFAYRQTAGTEDDAFAGTPGRKAYADKLQSIIDYGFSSDDFAITADVAGYYMHIDLAELERMLLSVSNQTDVVRDLCDLLRLWEALGLRGLPQGVRPSSPLGNLYLKPLDDLLADSTARYVRWMDDFVVAAGSFARAREVLDAIEHKLYGMRLTLAADKTKIRRYEVAYAETEDARARLQRIKTARQVEGTNWVTDAARWMDYPPNEIDLPDPATLQRDVTVEVYDELLNHLEDVDLPKTFQADIVATLRDLEALKEPCHIDRIPRLLTRAPDITGDVLRYVAGIAKASHQTACVGTFKALLTEHRFMREAEKLNLCAAVLALPSRAGVGELDEALGRWALEDPHPLVRARTLVAWGAQSSETGFAVVDEFWTAAKAPWRPYALIAIQTKTRALRDERYAEWSSSGRFLGRLADLLCETTLGWRKL